MNRIEERSMASTSWYLWRLSCVVVCAVLCLISFPTAFAQSSTASAVVGTVKDASGAAIPGAKVTVINLSTNATRVVSTNDAGEFNAQNLPPGNYSIRVERDGFKSAAVESVALEVGKISSQPIALEVGAVTETVNVTGEAPQLQTQEATVGQVISQQQVSELPLNGRNVLQLATLSAGVSGAQTGNTGSPGQFGQRNLYITVDGGRPSSTNYVIDGTYARSLRFNNLSFVPSVDSIQEFNIVRSVASTEYGQGASAVSMVTKSGSNTIHGSLFEYTRSEIFDARNYFSTVTAAPRKPVFHRNQFGGSLGTKILRDRLFAFGGFEAQRSVQAKLGYATYPTLAQLSGANYQLANALIPTFAPVLTPNCAAPCSGGNNFVFPSNFVDNFQTYVVRVDGTLSPKHSIFTRYIDYNSIQLTPSAQAVGQNPLIGRNVAIGDTYTFSSSIINELRLGYNRAYNYGITSGPYTNQSYASLAGVQNVTGLTTASEFGRPTVSIQGFSGLGGENGGNQGDTENLFSIADTVGITRGRHSVRTGVTLQQRYLKTLGELSSSGAFTFNATAAVKDANGVTVTPAYTGLQNFQRGFCTSCAGSAGSSQSHFSDQTYGVFANDVWQFGHGLTVNYGLRWEYIAPFVEKDGLEAGFDIAGGKIAFHKVPAICGATPTAACIPQSMITLGLVNLTPNFFPRGIIQPDKTKFAPRVGVAFQATQHLVIRGGFGIYIENTNTNELNFVRNIAPLYITQAITNSFVTGLFPSIANYQPTPGVAFPAPFGTNPANRTPYNDQWDLSIQQELGHQTVLELAYTGSVSHELWRRYDRNEDTTFAANSNTDPTKGAVAIRPYPQFSHGMLTSSNVGHANFNGGSVKLEQRPIKGFYYLGVYQWSKNLDDQSGEADANDTSYSTNLSFDRSVSNFDVRNRATLSGGYSLPFGAGHQRLNGKIGKAIAGGWSIQPIVSIRSGFPFSVSAGSAAFCTYCPWRANPAVGRTSGIISNPTPSHWFDATAYTVPTAGFQGTVTRNTLRGPGALQNDLSAIKNFGLWDRVTAQFRAEAFNVMNRKILANPAANLSSPATVGQVSATSADNRDLQFALKILW